MANPCVSEFETEAKRNSRSTFQRVSFLGWSSQCGTRECFLALTGLVGPVQENTAERVFLNKEPRNPFQGIDSVSLCRDWRAGTTTLFLLGS